jgi:hypothetical protein
MKRLHLLLVCLAALLAAGCGTPYRPRVPSFVEGFEDERLGLRTWTIRVGAGWPGEQPRLEQFALYRAAEIATAHGFRYFSLLPSSDLDLPVDVEQYAPDAPEPEPATRTPGHGPTFVQRFFNSKQFGRVHVARVTIRLLEANELSVYERVVDAEKILARLRHVVGR